MSSDTKLSFKRKAKGRFIGLSPKHLIHFVLDHVLQDDFYRKAWIVFDDVRKGVFN